MYWLASMPPRSASQLAQSEEYSSDFLMAIGYSFAFRSAAEAYAALAAIVAPPSVLIILLPAIVRHAMPRVDA